MTVRILVTGDRGVVGSEFVALATASGEDCVGFDLAGGFDVLDPPALRAAVSGCTAVVHLAAVDEDRDAPPELQPASRGDGDRVFAVNVVGTANVLAAASGEGVARVVLMSSVDVLGCFTGQGDPQFLPIDDDHPLDPKGPYAESKVAAEAQARAFAAATGGSVVILRAPGVVTARVRDVIDRARAEEPSFEWSPCWEYGAFIDVRDLAAALLAAVRAPVEGAVTLLVNADDISSASRTSAELAATLLPHVPLREPERYAREPYRALLDTSRAREVLGWAPRCTWRPTGGAEAGRRTGTGS